MPLPVDEAEAGDAPADEEQDAEVAEEQAPQPPRKKGRSSVPSWDEIMFGGGKNE